MCHSVVEVSLRLGGEKVLVGIVVVWVVKVDGVPLLVEHMTMLAFVEGVLVKDVVAHIVFEGVSMELTVPCIMVVAMELVVFLVVAMEPSEELEMIDVVIVMTLANFVAHVVLRVLKEFFCGICYCCEGT